MLQCSTSAHSWPRWAVVASTLAAISGLSKCGKIKNEKNLSQNESNKSQDRSPSPLVRNIVVVLVALSLNAANGISFGHIFYSSTYYQYLSVGISASKAAQILSVMSATFTIGRLVSVFVAIKVKTDIMIAYHLIIICAAMIFSYFGQNSITSIWIGNALIGRLIKLTSLFAKEIFFQEGGRVLYFCFYKELQFFIDIMLILKSSKWCFVIFFILKRCFFSNYFHCLVVITLSLISL